MQKYGLKIFPVIVVIIVILMAVGCTVSNKKNGKDFNIILISIDTLRADHLGCYKYHRSTSPSIDKFRENAILFRQCMAQAPSTLPSHASIFTSLVPSHHRAFFTRSQSLPDNVLTMAELLKQNGYRTMSFNDGGQIAAKFGLSQGFDNYVDVGPEIHHEDHSFQRIVNKTTRWLERPPKEKFFLFLHTYEPHSPYNPDQKYLDFFESNYNGNLPRHISNQLIDQINKGKIKINNEDIQHIINTYDAEIRSMDDSFGRLMALLKKKKLYDNTLIIFTSDHGEEFGEHGKWATHSHTLFNELLHVPLIIKLPGSKYASRKVGHVVRSIDILPTVMDLLGEKMSKDFEGISLVPLMKGIKPKGKVFVISQRDMPKTLVRGNWSIMNRKWKLYDSKLYDLLNDPGELVDCSGSNKDLKQSLEKYAIGHIIRKKVKSSTKKVTLDRQLKKRLKTLGYVD